MQIYLEFQKKLKMMNNEFTRNYEIVKLGEVTAMSFIYIDLKYPLFF